MVRLERINSKNVWEILDLRVNEQQRTFVADNRRSMIEAYLCIAGGGHVFPFAIFAGDTPVGFAMIGYGTDEEWENPPAVAAHSYNIWRFMIDERYQRKGYGKLALKLLLEFVSSMPCGDSEFCWLSYAPENRIAKKLYEVFGFSETGEMDEGELIAVCPISRLPGETVSRHGRDG